MTDMADAILGQLHVVQRERALRAADPRIAASVLALKAYQQRRFRRTYSDLLSDPRYASAARFFLEELYGPHDFTDRDAQFARIVPALVKLFPQELVATVHTLAALHALSERLDTEMARHLGHTLPLSASTYVRIWHETGRRQDRERQVGLLVAVGDSLDVYTRRPLLRQSLRLMRGPARAAGLGSLQVFLENGFDCFRSMKGAGKFLETVRARELALMEGIFSHDPSAPVPAEGPLGQLP